MSNVVHTRSMERFLLECPSETFTVSCIFFERLALFDMFFSLMQRKKFGNRIGFGIVVSSSCSTLLCHETIWFLIGFLLHLIPMIIILIGMEEKI